jgi:hypothetical protein
MNVRVPGFLPTINGLHFTNSWPTGTGPDYTFNVLGQTIKLGDASNGLSPLGLVHGQEPPTVGFFTGIQDFGNCHQVLAWGYDLNGSSLTIHIYDPDYVGDQNTITLDIANPAHTTPITVSNHNGFYRGFFRTHYAYHDPRTPVSAAFIATVVRSPGIVSPGPLPPRPDEPGGYVLIPGKVKAISWASGNAGSPLLFVIGTDDQVYAQELGFRLAGGSV